MKTQVYKYNGVNKVVKSDNGVEQVVIFCSKGDALSPEQGSRLANIACAIMNEPNLFDEVEQLISTK